MQFAVGFRVLDCPAQLSLLSCFPSVEGILEPVLKDKGILFFTMDSLWEMGWNCSAALWMKVFSILSSLVEGALCSLNTRVRFRRAAIR